MMQRLEIAVNTAVGLHARPAANLVKLAMAYQSNILLEKGDRKVSARSILSVLSLAVRAGECITVHADGVDEAEALTAIKNLAAHNFE
jgi:phosphotransferase system HPr (HPr) family protein